jgi:hypothetical protein
MHNARPMQFAGIRAPRWRPCPVRVKYRPFQDAWAPDAHDGAAAAAMTEAPFAGKTAARAGAIPTRRDNFDRLE